MAKIVASGRTIADLAAAADIPVEELRDIAAGFVPVSLDVAVKLLVALGKELRFYAVDSE